MPRFIVVDGVMIRDPSDPEWLLEPPLMNYPGTMFNPFPPPLLYPMPQQLPVLPQPVTILPPLYPNQFCGVANCNGTLFNNPVPVAPNPMLTPLQQAHLYPPGYPPGFRW